MTINIDDKKVALDYSILPIFDQRWSPDCFTDRPVEDEKLRAMFFAARSAPSAHNSQPWRFVLARKEHPADYYRVLECLYPANQQWARTAPVLILGAAATVRVSIRDCTHVPLFHRQFDLGLAVACFILQGQSVGVHCHPMAGFDEKKAAEVLEIPEAFEPVIAIAVGYPTEKGRRPGSARGTRRPLHDLVFEGKWSEPSELLQDFQSSLFGSAAID